MQLISFFHGHLHVADLFAHHDLTLLAGVERSSKSRNAYLSVRSATNLLDGPERASSWFDQYSKILCDPIVRTNGLDNVILVVLHRS